MRMHRVQQWPSRFCCDPFALFGHFRSELRLLNPETLKRTYQGIVRNGKQFKTQSIYSKGIVPAYSVPLSIGDVDDDDTASSPPNVREQEEANRQRVAQVEVVCDEKVRTLETALESQSQEVSHLRKAYSNMYSFLEQMRSGGSGLAAFTTMLPRRLRRSPRLDHRVLIRS
ncbi:hypothetical protein PIB30_021718 [Stylosanthes scabra]|uniref:Uncharacterized protein n=1 Tax=Stylosanthes scabra TaxID=79078 RepID=A0ABU6S985_9FABA|nr:hypothetical protein [Stylosanthes scabra]